MAAPRIELRAVGMRYCSQDGETEALAGLDLAVAPGEFAAVVGPSGCGKSTILSLIAGVLRPTAGEVLVDGRPVAGPSRRVGYMLQRDHLFDWRTVEENCLVGPEVQGLDLRAARERVARLLEQTGLLPFRHAYPDQLSGGMRQRVALVRTLAIDPAILLLDEPFSALDFQTRLKLADEVAAILRAQGKTAVLVTHDIPEAITMADRVLVLTGRPARVRSEHLVRYAGPQRPTPFAAREAPEFSRYFQRIWEELQGHEQS
ncbi:MAG TPA: ABC transporter ATP-binding protein [Symbiobacteriaceae bacterium]|nr:ABC transporter ATP-binding protein [Symbiobacteriaceae bacterium]